MRAVVVDRHGPPDVLTVASVEQPVPGPREVRVRVRAAGVQPFDTYVRRGLPGFGVELPHRLGNEFAGVVDVVGDAVADWCPGDAVIGWAPMRSMAEYVVVDDTSMVSKPSAMPWIEAGGIGASGQTALTALRDLAVGAGDTLLVHAAAGGAGSAAVQLARRRGARVIGTASASRHSYLEGIGAVPVTYGPGLVERVRTLAPDGIDAVLDGVGGQALRDSLALADPGRIATLADHALADELGVRGVRAQRSLDQLHDLVHAWQEGALRVPIRARYTLEEVASAHRDVESRHGAGKVVVTVPDP